MQRIMINTRGQIFHTSLSQPKQQIPRNGDMARYFLRHVNCEDKKDKQNTANTSRPQRVLEN